MTIIIKFMLGRGGHRRHFRLVLGAPKACGAIEGLDTDSLGDPQWVTASGAVTPSIDSLLERALFVMAETSRMQNVAHVDDRLIINLGSLDEAKS